MGASSSHQDLHRLLVPAFLICVPCLQLILPEATEFRMALIGRINPQCTPASRRARYSMAGTALPISAPLLGQT